ncbi:MAG: hypothetical protein K8823_344 [Cenarchaeum symbiont of Oopsacas minuta]|nr:hypothetical protein [Cenarchaeum symbiont of Oopsacas minuta]
MTTAIYLAHLNPLTNSHVNIIKKLQKKADSVTIMPVIFRKRGVEVNSKSFPFSFESRSAMIKAVFENSVNISDRYTFNAPFVKYLPPLISVASWMLRQKIVAGYGKDYFTYTGDKNEWRMLKSYCMQPMVGEREPISATSVKEAIYSGKDWKSDVSEKIVPIIEENAKIIKQFSTDIDKTTRVGGMKFPKDGFWCSCKNR